MEGLDEFVVGEFFHVIEDWTAAGDGRARAAVVADWAAGCREGEGEVLDKVLDEVLNEGIIWWAWVWICCA